MSEWKPIETAPQSDVIIISDGIHVSIGWWSGEGFSHWLPAISGTPTHWTPLPAAPKPEDKTE